MIAWLLGLAGAVSEDGAQLWWPLGVEQTASGATVAAVIPADGAFFVSHGASWDCDSLEVWDPVGPVAVRCDPVASATSGDLAILSPDPRWPVGETLDVRAGGTAFTDAFAVLDEDASTDHGAAPDERTVLDSGVSYRICNRGVVGMALRGLEARPRAR